jgi:signal transduction histidine kinase
VLGYFEIWDSQIEREYDEADKRLLLAFATQTALAIEHVQLLETLEQRVAERTSELVNERDKLNVALKELAAARDQALAASRLKTELLAKVSHELRTPLAAILGLAEVLDLGVYGPISGKQQQTVAQIIDSAQYLTGLVNELLDQAQLEAGKLKLDMRPFAPADVLDHTVAKLSVLAQAKGLTLTAGMAADVPETLSGDPARVQQVLVNLVSNAIKFTQAGTVQVRLYRPDAIYWAMEVSDTGPGIPFEAQAYIFEPFRQVDGSMTRAHIGAGLGLSIVKQLTTLMGGQVTLESEVGRGSTFTVQLPLSPIQKRIP